MSNPIRKNDTAAGSNPRWTGPPIAIFWDQSLIWGLICLETLNRLGVPYHLLSGEDIGAGALARYRVLLTPGGWASHKLRALGDAGKSEVRNFIERGGSYIGFCGGAGLALSSPPALGLVPLERMPLPERLPSASGGVWIRGIPDHPAWKNLPQSLPVSIWWPSQFRWQPLPRTFCLASYASPGADFRVADLPVADLENHGFPWEEWENIYGINLNPVTLMGHPAVMEIRMGKGRLVLSYPHLETPDDTWGNRLFLNILIYLDGESSKNRPRCDSPRMPAQCQPGHVPGSEAMDHLIIARKSADDLIQFGERHLLWNWRRPWLLNWRRGIRGLEYGTLALMMGKIVNAAEQVPPASSQSYDPWLEPAKRLKENIAIFCHLARLLLLEEKLATQSGNLTKLGKVNESVDQLRNRLFGDKMNHGGLCRAIMDDLDRHLLEILRLPCSPLEPERQIG